MVFAHGDAVRALDLVQGRLGGDIEQAVMVLAIGLDTDSDPS